MKRIVLALLIGILVISGMPLDASAGPWTLKQGKLWSEVYTRYFISDQYFDPKGEKHRWPDGGESTIIDLEVKFEYGATDKLNLLLGIPYTWTKWRNDWGQVWNDNWGDNTGMVDREGFKAVNFGAKYRIIEKPVVVAVQGKFFIDVETDQYYPPDLYDYGSAFELRGLVGKAFTIKKKLVYFSVESGYRWQINSDWANTIPVFIEGGFAPLDWFMIKSELDCSFSHQGTGTRKDYMTWRVGPIFNVLGKGFNSIEKGGDNSLNIEFQYGMTIWGRGDGQSEQYQNTSKAQEFIAKVQVLF